MAIQLEFLNSVKGDRRIYIEDSSPEGRAQLAESITRLLREGNAVFLIQGKETRLLRGYDPDANEWLVASTPQPRPAQAHVPVGGGSVVTVVGRRAGG